MILHCRLFLRLIVFSLKLKMKIPQNSKKINQAQGKKFCAKDENSTNQWKKLNYFIVFFCWFVCLKDCSHERWLHFNPFMIHVQGRVKYSFDVDVSPL